MTEQQPQDIDVLSETSEPNDVLRADKRSVTFGISAEFSSLPIPSPEMLARYKALIPNAPERWMQLLEQQTAHRQQEETRQVKGYFRTIFSGQILGFIIAASCIACAFYGMINGKSLGYVALFLSPAVLGVVHALIRGKK